MKQFFATLLLLAVGGGFSACSDDDASSDPRPEALAQPVPAASQIGEDSFSISWEPVEGALSYTYTLQHKGAHGSVTLIVPETSTEVCSAAFTELKPATPYTFRIKAVGDGTKTADSEWAELTVTTEQPVYLSGPWVEIGEVTYQKHNYMPSYCYINVAFRPNDKTSVYSATVVNGDYFDDEPDNPDFIPNTEEDLTNYLLAQSAVSDDKIREQNYWGREVIIATIGIDADGQTGKLNWKRHKIPTKSEFEGGGEITQSEASLRIQHVVINSGELEGAPAGCFATVYRFEVTKGARSFRYEDGFYEGDFAAKTPDAWRDYFMSISNAYGEKFDGYYSGWKSSMELEGGSDGLYYYDATFWDSEMAGETFEVLYLAFDGDAVPGAPGCYTVTLPKTLPEITPTDPAASAEYRAAAEAARRIARERGIALRRR